MILLDLSHTAHTRARTGIQRVCRSLYRELPRTQETTPVTWDPYARQWRTLQAWERLNLDSTTPGKKRGSHWPLAARLRGQLSAWLSGDNSGASLLPATAQALLVPEMFSPGVAQALPRLRAQTGAPVAVVFHDAIALKYPELSPAATVARYPAYLQELAGFDGVAAVSEDSRQTLLKYWDWLGIRRLPETTCIPLGIDLPRKASATPLSDAGRAAPEILCLCSLEGRKNHLALLDATEKLWRKGLRFSLVLAGFAQKETGTAVLAKVAALQGAGFPLRHGGPLSEEAMEAAYASCDFTVYPSLMEGFGLPVLESLARGKPCICSGAGALGESSTGGGCVQLMDTSSGSIAAAVASLVENPSHLTALRKEAKARKFRTWADYARELSDWSLGLRTRTTR